MIFEVEKKGYIRNIAKRFYSILLTWIIFPLIGVIVAGAVINRIKDRFIQPGSYKAYLVGNDKVEDSTEFTDKIWEGFIAGEKLKIDGVPIEFRRENDRGEEEIAKSISASIAKRHDTLMVVGHIYSTPTRAALPNYLQKADPPIPVILTTETNPDLLPTESDTYYPVFRLSPTDKKQAEVAADLVVSKKGAKAIWVVEDTLNPVYSRYLAREFVDQAQLKSGKVLLWTMNQEIPSAAAVEALGIDWIFFAGNWSNALILIRQIKAIRAGKPMPDIILSEWCANPELIRQGGDDVERVYLTHQLNTAQYQAGGDFWGKAAHELLRRVIENANDEFEKFGGSHGGLGYWIRWILGFHSADDARMVVKDSMQWMAEKHYEFKLPYEYIVHFSEHGGTLEERRSDGTFAERRFNVWQVQGKGFKDCALDAAVTCN